MILADKIIEYLKKTGTTRKDFAEKADVPLSTLNSILNGTNPNPTYITVLKVAKAGNISLDGIAGITNSEMGDEEISRIKKEHAETKEQLQEAFQKHSEQIAQRQEVLELKNQAIKGLEERNAELSGRIKSQVTVINIFRVWILALHIYGLAMDSLDTSTGLIRFPLLDIIKQNGLSITEVIIGAIILYVIIFWLTKSIWKEKK